MQHYSRWLIDYIYIQTNTLDEASRKRDERNRQQRKRRAEMTTEQREEANRKQREYRARKKATTHNTTTSRESFKTSLSLLPLTTSIIMNPDS